LAAVNDVNTGAVVSTTHEIAPSLVAAVVLPAASLAVTHT
jgi:hypothetical protein